MRVDRNTFPGCWLVWHVPLCRELRRVLWVSDEPPQYAEAVEPLQVVDGQLLRRVVDCKRVVIRPESRLVLIDPVDDAEDEQAPRLAFEFIYTSTQGPDALQQVVSGGPRANEARLQRSGPCGLGRFFLG